MAGPLPLELAPWALGALCGYVLASCTLLAFPQLLHRKRRTLALAHGSHRGGAAECTENTLPAFRHAVRCGTDLLELDVHLTADRQVVVVHDAELSRMCGVARTVAGTRYDDLPRYLPADSLQLPPPFHAPGATLASEAGANPAPERGQPVADVRRIPLLSEVFAEFPAVVVNVDLKGADPDGVLRRSVHALVAGHRREARTIWGSFDDAKVRACHASDPRIPTMFSGRGVVVLLVLFYAG